MRVRVLFFGVLKDRRGCAEELLEFGEGATVGEVLVWATDWIGDRALLRSLAVAVNREYAGASTELRDGDEVALLPPVSGGVVSGE